jgi:O-antigen ligase
MAYQSTLPARIQRPVLGSPAPIVIGGLVAALVVGVLLARSAAIGIGAVLALVYAPILFLNLPLGVALFVPLEFVDRLPAASIGPTAASVLVLLAWLVTLPARRRVVAATFRRTPALYIVLALLLIWMTISIAWAVDPGGAANEFWNWWVAAATLVVVATSFSQRRFAMMLCAAFVVGALISVVAGLLPGAPASASGLPAEAGRFSGSYGDPNFLAAGLVPAIALTVGLLAVTRRSGARTLLLLAAAILTLGLAASGSRGGLVAAAVSGVVALVVARGRRLPILVTIAGAMVVVGVWIATTSPGSWDRVRKFDTGTGRTDLWDVAWRMSEAHPLAGVGLDGYVKESPRFIRQPGVQLPTGTEFTRHLLNEPLVAHNTYLQLLAETGFVGLALFAALVLASLRATWLASRSFERQRDPPMASLARAALIAQIGALSAAIFISDYYDKRLWVLLAMGPALLAVAARGGRSDTHR